MTEKLRLSSPAPGDEAYAKPQTPRIFLSQNIQFVQDYDRPITLDLSYAEAVYNGG